MVERFDVNGYESLMELINENLPKSRPIYVLFRGAKDDEGQSWCVHCAAAELVVEEVLKTAPEASLFISCSVGDQQSWRDPNNPFRKDDNLKLRRIPTVCLWNTPKRLEGDQCKNANLVSLLVEDD